MFTKRQRKLILLADVLLLTSAFAVKFLIPILSNGAFITAVALLLPFGAPEPVDQIPDITPSPTLAGLPEIPEDILRADFTWTGTTIPGKAAVRFTDQSSGHPIAWYWDFGDGKTAKGRNQTHAYAMSGLYEVELTVVNATHHTDTVVIECLAPNSF